MPQLRDRLGTRGAVPRPRARRAHAWLVLVILSAPAMVSLPDPAAAARGDLDPSFGPRAGRPVRIDFGWADDYAQRVWSLENDRIVVAGVTGGSIYDELPNVAFARLLPNGAHDSSFGRNGKRVVFAERNHHVAPVAPTSRGRTVIVDHPPDGPDGIRIRRLLRNGSLDRTFGDRGQVIDHPFVAPRSAACLPAVLCAPAGGWVALDTVAIQPDGDIILAAYVGAAACSWGCLAGTWSYVLIRYEADGRRDSTFGIDGRAPVSIAALAAPSFAVGAGVLKIVPQQGGTILVAGPLAGPDLTWHVGVSRFLADGTPDTTFGVGGVARADFGSTDWFADIETGPDGSIYLLANTWDGTPYASSSRIGIARLTPAGVRDASFGTGGIVRLHGKDEWAEDLVVLGRRGVAVAYNRFCGEECRQGWVAILTTNGSGDPRVGGRGHVRVSMAPVSAVTWTARGLVVAGEVATATRGTDFAIARLIVPPRAAVPP